MAWRPMRTFRRKNTLICSETSVANMVAPSHQPIPHHQHQPLQLTTLPLRTQTQLLTAAALVLIVVALVLTVELPLMIIQVQTLTQQLQQPQLPIQVLFVHNATRRNARPIQMLRQHVAIQVLPLSMDQVQQGLP